MCYVNSSTTWPEQSSHYVMLKPKITGQCLFSRSYGIISISITIQAKCIQAFGRGEGKGEWTGRTT